MLTRFLLLLGVSGVGKSTIITELRKLDDRFVYVSPYITRALRHGEKDKISIADHELDEMSRRGEFLVINRKYGIRYATPLDPIISSLNESRFPVLDWPINRLSIMTEAFAGRLCVVYLLPPSVDELQRRINSDGRDKDGLRFSEAIKELQDFNRGMYDGLFSMSMTTHEGKSEMIARAIREHYLNTL